MLADFGSRAIGSFNRNELQRRLEGEAADGVVQKAIDHLRWNLNQVFRMAEFEGSLSRSPATLLYAPRAAGRTSTRRMNSKKIILSLSVLDTRGRLTAMLAVIDGMRTGEILALQWRHVFADRIEVVQRIHQRQIETPKTLADQLGNGLDVTLDVYAMLGLGRRREGLELLESRLRGDAAYAA